MTQEILDEIFELYPDALTMDGSDDCILGACERFGMETVVAYDKTKVLAKLQQDDGMTPEESEEFFYFNQIGAWMGETTLVFVTLYE